MFEYIYTVQNTILLGMGWVNQHYAFAYMDDDYHISKTPFELATFFFCGDYRSPSFAFQHQHLSQFSALMTTVKFYKTIFRFSLFNLPIDHVA